MASMTGYRSPVDLGLSRIPLTTNPELFNEFTDVYNAIHLLNQYLDQLRNAVTGGGTEQAPSETMPFSRFFVGVAKQAVEIGDVVSPSSLPSDDKMLLGALAHNKTLPLAENNFCGIALTAAAIGENFRVGVGPAVLAVPGAISGHQIWAYSSLSKAGAIVGDPVLYLTSPGVKSMPAADVAYPMPVGVCIANGYVLIGKFIRR